MTYDDTKPVRRTPVEQGRIVTVKRKEGVKKISARQILYAESFGRKVVLHLPGDRIEYYQKIGELERELGSGFFRVHRSYLIALSAVSSFTRDGVILKCGDSVLLSKYKYKSFAQAYANYRSRLSFSAIPCYT